MKNLSDTLTGIVILSGVAGSRSEADTQSKDPYPVADSFHAMRRSPNAPCAVCTANVERAA